ncbi:MAG TPA: amidase [Bryobacteraceae bacterium]|jgi:aspartyl-tRNA(Asn)/glutamyl-tRNA(Gln) amidotransferase subunit A|nr:amidase [Bryobacteraceae bacterium]
MKGSGITDEIFFASIAQLNTGLKERDFSAVELVRAFAKRLETLGPRYNALALPLTEIAGRRAKEVDDELKRQRYRGALQGIPFGAKDLLSLAGHPTTWGAKPYASQVFDETATVLQKLDKTGSILIGKLSMVELAGGGGYRTTAASLFGPGLNPWDTSRWSGGSSSGPASAVAAGLVPYALGSETSGSILSPSAYCGVTGLRPTYGLVSRHGAMALSWTMDKIGPLCRSAEDCGLVLQAIAGSDSKDPGSAGKSFYYTPQYARNLADITVGFASDDLAWADADSHPALQAAMQVIRSTGVKMVEATLPDLPYSALADMVIGSEGGAIFEPLIASGKVNELADPSQAASLKANLGIAAKDYLRAMRIRSVLQQKFHELFSTVDILVAPTRYNAAPKITDPLDGPDPTPSGQPATPGLRWLIPAGNLAGLPALSIPCGFAPGNLPVALQLVGPAFSENTLLALGRAFQSATDWHKRRPPLVS